MSKLNTHFNNFVCSQVLKYFNTVFIKQYFSSIDVLNDEHFNALKWSYIKKKKTR